MWCWEIQPLYHYINYVGIIKPIYHSYMWENPSNYIKLHENAACLKITKCCAVVADWHPSNAQWSYNVGPPKKMVRHHPCFEVRTGYKENVQCWFIQHKTCNGQISGFVSPKKISIPELVTEPLNIFTSNDADQQWSHLGRQRMSQWWLGKIGQKNDQNFEVSWKPMENHHF